MNEDSLFTMLADKMTLAHIEHDLENGHELHVILANMVGRYAMTVAKCLDRQGMPNALLAMVPATFHAFQMQIADMIRILDDTDDLDENDPLVLELKEKAAPLCDLANGLIDRLQSKK